VKKGKRIRKAYESFDRTISYPIEKAISIVKSCASAKFDETTEVAVNLGVDARKVDQMVRGVCSLPNGTGKSLRVAVFARGEKAEEARTAGADVVGAEDLVETISKGEINFDRCIATPDVMPLVSRVGKILGPRGLMPNPKVGTVTMDVAKAVQDARSGATVAFKIDRAGVVHAGVGKVSFQDQSIIDNIRAFVKVLSDAKPSGVRGQYLRRIAISSSMGVGVKVDFGSLSLGQTK